MNALRYILTSRTVNYLRQNGHNAIINATKQPPPVPLSGLDVDNKSLTDAKRAAASSLSIPPSILDACRFTSKPFDITGNSANAKGSLSPTTLKRFRRMQRRMEIVYMCKLCNTRNTKTISEEAYCSGVVILQCDGCAVDHLIKDNLGLFANGESIDEVLSKRQERIRIVKVNEHGELI